MSDVQNIVESVVDSKAEFNALQNPVETKPQPVKEEPKIEAKPEEKDDHNLAARFAALSRRERQIVEKEKTLKGFEEKINSFEKSKKSAKIDPVAWLEQGGITYDELTQYILNNNQPTKDTKVSLELQDLRERLEKQEQEKKEREEKDRLEAENRAIDNYKKQITDYAKTNADKYELINQSEEFETVFEVCEQYFAVNHKLLPIETACEQVEKYLEEKAEKFFTAKKFADKLKSAQVEDKKLDVNATPSATLTNKPFVAHSPTISPEGRVLTREESLKRAASLLKWNE
jgi:hypothetical protein